MAWVFESIDKTFANFQQITDEEKEFITEQINVVNKLMKYNELFTEFQRSYDEYLSSTYGTDKNKSKDLVRYIKNYLTSYKGYIDGMETVLSRSFDNKIYESFKELQKNAYDNNFSYRFIYNLRNYAQHCGTPISNIRRVINEETIINLKVDKFLSEHTGMQKSFRKELENFAHDAINVGGSIKSVTNIIIDMQSSIFNLMINNNKDEVFKSAYDLIEFYNKNSKNKGVLYIAKDTDIEGLTELKSKKNTEINMKFIQIQHELAKFILENVSAEYIFRGINIGQSKKFPVMFKVQSVIEIPKFRTGARIVSYNDIKWIKVM